MDNGAIGRGVLMVLSGAVIGTVCGHSGVGLPVTLVLSVLACVAIHFAGKAHSNA